MTAIGDETMQYIILQMINRDHKNIGDCRGMRVGEIADITRLSRPAISHHLQILKDSGVLKMRREGTRNFYYFDEEMKSLQRLIDMLIHVKGITINLPDRRDND